MEVDDINGTPDDVDPKVVAGRIRILYRESGKTKAAFADWLGVSGQTYYSWERGYRTPAWRSLFRISRKAQVSIEWILGQVDERGEDEL